MKAKSIKGKTAEDIQSALQQSMVDGFKPTFAIVFVSIKQDRSALQKIFTDANIEIFGVTSNGEFIDEETTQGATAILLLDIHKNYLQLYFEEYPNKNYREVAISIAKKAKEKFNKAAFLIACSGLETDAEQLLLGFEDVIGEQVKVFGGMAGDDLTFSGQFVFTNNRLSDKGVVVIALDENKMAIRGRATCEWKAVGTERTVTKSEGNHVYTVDNIPVLDITAKYGGIENVSPDNKNLLLELATNFPLQLQKEKGNPVMRPGLSVDWSDHSFYCSGSVPQGSKIRFSLPPDFDVIEKVIKSCEDLKVTEIPDAEAVVVFSCAGRLLAFGPLVNDEIEGIKKVWNAPMAGMFSNAELARATGGNLEMHNLTVCVVALKEK
jgi:hypothetical protein